MLSTFYRLRDKVNLFDSILLKRAQIVCIILGINPIENEETSSAIIGTGAICIHFFLVYAIKSTFYPMLLKLAQIIGIIIDVDVNPVENE